MDIRDAHLVEGLADSLVEPSSSTSRIVDRNLQFAIGREVFQGHASRFFNPSGGHLWAYHCTAFVHSWSVFWALRYCELAMGLYPGMLGGQQRVVFTILLRDRDNA